MTATARAADAAHITDAPDQRGTGTTYLARVDQADAWAVAVAELDRLALEHDLDAFTVSVGRALVAAADRSSVVAYSQVRAVAIEVGASELKTREALALLFKAGWWTGCRDGLRIFGGAR